MTRSKLDCFEDEQSLDPMDPELRDILRVMFCSCLKEFKTRDSQTRRELFRMTEIDGQPLVIAAETMGLDIENAERILTETRREVAVLMVLGLSRPSDTGSAGKAKLNNCNC